MNSAVKICSIKILKNSNAISKNKIIKNNQINTTFYHPLTSCPVNTSFFMKNLKNIRTTQKFYGS